MSAEKKETVRPNRAPFSVGVGAAVVAIVLSIAGMIRNTGLASLNLVSLLLVVLIAGGSWGVVAWAITTAVYDVEDDVAAEETTTPAAGK